MRIVIRYRRRPDAAGRFLFGSLGAHSIALGLILVVPSLRSAKRPTEPLMVVELAGSIPSAPAAASRAPASAAPPPAREPDGAHAVKELPPPPSKKKPAPKEKPKEAEPPRDAPPPGPSAPPTGEGAGPAQDPAAGAGTPGITSLDNADPGLAWYNASVTGALQAAWVRPVLEGAQRVLSVVVSFEIDRAGGVRDVRIDVPSGIPSLDRSALRAVSDAAPFPRPPVGHDVVRQRIRFDLIPESL